MTTEEKRFRVALSFAGETRAYVAEIAAMLATRFGKEAVLYDKYHEAEFARRDLGFYLPELYHNQSELVVVIICSHYESKEWCGLEWDAVFDLLKKRGNDEVMLCRFGRAELRGLYSTAGFVDLDDKSTSEAAELILERLALNGRKELKRAKGYAPHTNTLASKGGATKRGARRSVWAWSFLCLLVGFVTWFTPYLSAIEPHYFKSDDSKTQIEQIEHAKEYRTTIAWTAVFLVAVLVVIVGVVVRSLRGRYSKWFVVSFAAVSFGLLSILFATFRIADWEEQRLIVYPAPPLLSWPMHFADFYLGLSICTLTWGLLHRHLEWGKDR